VIEKEEKEKNKQPYNTTRKASTNFRTYSSKPIAKNVGKIAYTYYKTTN